MTDLSAALAPIRARLDALSNSVNAGAEVSLREDAEASVADTTRLLAAVEAVERTAANLDRLADGDRHYANLFRQAVTAALSATTHQEGTPL